MEHDGRAFAADERDGHHHLPAGMASVHVRVLVTWLAIFPMVTMGMYLLAVVGVDWAPVLKALVLTAVVVPTAVYLVVPRLLRGHSALARRRTRRSAARSARRRRRATSRSKGSTS
jgi:antibiotic biosynthesis monooxygenase (ABM) superfamily enzyme